MRRKLDDQQVEALRRDYTAWKKSPGERTAIEVARSHGVSKHAMYQLKAKGWRYGQEVLTEDKWTIRRLEAVIVWLTAELVAERAKPPSRS